MAVRSVVVVEWTALRRGGVLVLAVTLLLNAAGIIAAQSENSRAAQIREHLQKAAGYLQKNDPDSAVQEFNAVLTLDPRNAKAFANLGVIAFFRGDYQNAAGSLGKALAIDPSLMKTEALLGICERRLGRPSAQALLEKSFPQLKDKKLATQVGLELADIYYQQGNLGRSASMMGSLVDLDPDNTEVLYMAQRAYSDLADETLNKLAILAPGSSRMQQVIAEGLINAGDLKGAIVHYRKSLEINPRVPGVRYELAEALLQSAPSDPAAQAEAKSLLETAAKMEGDTAKIECALAGIAARQSDTASANEHYTRAFALNPHEVDADIGMARMLMSAGKAREAIKYLRIAIESDPLNSEAHYRLASAYRNLQMQDEASKEIRLFQEIKQTKAQIRELYQQMNKRSHLDEEQASDIPQ